MNAPLRWPNSSLSTRFSRQGAAVDRDERHVGALALLEERAGGQFLAGAGLAEDQHGRVGRRDGGDQAMDAGHRPASCRPGSSGPSAACTRRLQGEVLVLELALLGDLAQDRLDLGQLARLGDVVERAEPDRLDGGLHAGVAGHDDGFGVRARPA